jgi:hypothetical protein
VTLLAHAIGRAMSAEPPSTGLRGRPLRRIAPEGRALGLWATGWDGPPGPLGRDDALGHHAIVAAIAAAGPCLPVRFGSWVANEAAAAALLAGRLDALEAALARVTGRSELAVTLLWQHRRATPDRTPAAAPPASGAILAGPGPGRRFLEDRRRDLGEAGTRHAAAEALADRFVSLLGNLGIDQADVRQDICPAAEVALSLSVLVPDARALQVKAAARRLGGALEGVRGVVSGPWPPYSFTAELA